MRVIFHVGSAGVAVGDRRGDDLNLVLAIVSPGQVGKFDLVGARTSSAHVFEDQPTVILEEICAGTNAAFFDVVNVILRDNAVTVEGHLSRLHARAEQTGIFQSAVITRAAMESVAAEVILEPIVAGVSIQIIIPLAAREIIISRAAEDRIVPRAATDRVVARACVDQRRDGRVCGRE